MAQAPARPFGIFYSSSRALVRFVPARLAHFDLCQHVFPRDDAARRFD